MPSAGGSTSKYANAPWALALCDRCGFPYKLRQLHVEFYDQRPNGLLVCATCLDQDQPQLQLGLLKIDDPQALRNPRPDNSRQGSVTLFGWAPVGNPLNNAQVAVGNVIIV